MSDAIDAFWTWWAQNADALERAIGDRSLPDWAPRISERVKAIDGRLDWEFGAGRRAPHYFCLSAKGDPVLRVLAERWRSRGPSDHPVFEFHASRPGGGAL